MKEEEGVPGSGVRVKGKGWPKGDDSWAEFQWVNRGLPVEAVLLA